MSRFDHVYLVNSAQSQYSRPPAGLAFLAGICEKCDTAYTVLDLNLNFLEYAGKRVFNRVYAYALKDLESVPPELATKIDEYLLYEVNKIKESNADLVAMTVLTFCNQSWAQRFLTLLRQHTSITVIIGGPGVSVPRQNDRNQQHSFGRYLAINDLVDFYVCGEGDLLFERFLMSETNEAGLNTKHGRETWQPQLDNLNSLAIPSYRNIDINRYNSPEQTPVLSVTGSRGCVRSCSFCDVGHLWKKFRYRDGTILAQELVKHWQDTGAKNFWFTDSLINGSLRQFKDFQTALLDASQKWPEMGTITYSGQFIIRPKSSHNEELFRQMKDTGCHHIQVGIESGSESVRDHMGKKFSNSDIDYHFEMCEKYGIKNYLLLMVGYPTETLEDFQDTLDMIKRYQKYIINDTALGIHLSGPARILTNTPLFDMRHELGLDDGLATDHNQEWCPSTNPSLTATERHRRWVELTLTALDLGYNLPSETTVNLTSHLESWRDHVRNKTNASTSQGTNYSVPPVFNGKSDQSLLGKKIPIAILS